MGSTSQFATAAGRIPIHRHKLFAHRAYPFDEAKLMSEHGLSRSDFINVLNQIRNLVDKYSQLITGTTTDTRAPPQMLKADLAWFIQKARPDQASEAFGAAEQNPQR